MTIELPFESALHDPHRLCANRIETLADQWGEDRDALRQALRDNEVLQARVKDALVELSKMNADIEGGGWESLWNHQIAAIDILRHGTVNA